MASLAIPCIDGLCRKLSELKSLGEFGDVVNDVLVPPNPALAQYANLLQEILERRTSSIRTKPEFVIPCYLDTSKQQVFFWSMIYVMQNV